VNRSSDLDGRLGPLYHLPRPLAHIQFLLQHLLKEAGDLRGFPLMMGVNADKRIEDCRKP
jgi:hypothetical protein